MRFRKLLGMGSGGRIVSGVSRARPVTGDSVLPEKVDAIIIGGGIVGCSTALALAERGVRVALCEKGVIAGEASGRSLGWVDSQLLDPVKMELIGRSKALWADLNTRTGRETGYRPSGLVSLFADAETVAFAASWVASVNGMPGVDARILTAREADEMQPGATAPWAGGLFQASDASAEPTLAAPAIAEAARRHGAFILQQTAVRGVERRAGRIAGVITERGPIAADAVVLAGGAWSPLFARSLGLDLPQFQIHASMLRVGPPQAAGPRVSAWGPGFAWRPQTDGGYTIAAINGAVPITPAIVRNLPRLAPAIRRMWREVDPVFHLATFLDHFMTPGSWPLDRPSPFEKRRILQPEVRHERLDEVSRTLRTIYPVFASAREEERWAGVLVSTLDNMPVVSGVIGWPGLYLGTGFYYGLTMGPAAGEALADLVMGRSPRVDLSHYRFDRFTDGSKLMFRS